MDLGEYIIEMWTGYYTLLLEVLNISVLLIKGYFSSLSLISWLNLVGLQ
jgi:hypothetical protein